MGLRALTLAALGGLSFEMLTLLGSGDPDHCPVIVPGLEDYQPRAAPDTKLHKTRAPILNDMDHNRKGLRYMNLEA